MQNFFGNIRYALRQFRHSPVFTVGARAFLAAIIPAMRAAAIQPMEALRAE